MAASPSDSCQVAFIGCGAVSGFHADALRSLGASISAVCGRPGSPNVGEFARRYDVPRTYRSWQELLDRERPDALWVVASWDQLDGMLVPLLESGVPCLVEKPAALTAARLREAIAARNRSGARVLVGYNRRFYDFVPRLKAILATEALRAIEAHIPEMLPGRDERVEGSLSRYMWLVKCSHVLDLLCYLVGRPAVTSLIRGLDETLRIPVSFNGLLRTRGDVPIHLAANWGAPDRYGLTFYYGDTMVRLSPIECMRIFCGLCQEAPTAERPIRSFVPRLVEEQFVDMTYKPGFQTQALNFVNTCVRQRQENTVGCTLEDALALIELCDEIRGEYE